MNPNVQDEADDQIDQATKNADSAQIVIPDAVRDIVSYKRYVALKDAPSIKLPNRLIETSDVNITIDPVGHLAQIARRIADLPSDEQDEILKRSKAIKVLHFRIGALKEKAYGLKKRKRHSSLVMGLLDERASELIEYFGRLLTDGEVHKIVTVEWGYELSLDTVAKFRIRNKAKIEVVKQEFIKDFSSIRLSHKRGRLEELQQIYVSRKMKWETTQSKDDEKMLVQVLREIRNETQDNTLRIDANINANINVTIQNHIEDEVMKRLTLNDIIIARAASKMRVNPSFLITRLHNSFYAKHSGMVEPDGDLKDQELIYPSKMVYNWKDIKAQHDKYGDKNVEEANWEEIDDTKKVQGQDIQTALKALIGQRKSDLDRAQERVDSNAPTPDLQ